MNEASKSTLSTESQLSCYAVTTRSRHEKVVAEQLWQKKIECFLPLRAVLSKWKDRRKKVQFPLFAGYLFVNVSMMERRLDILKISTPMCAELKCSSIGLYILHLIYLLSMHLSNSLI